MRLVLGALRQLVQPFDWDVPDDATRNTVLDWMDTFIGIFAGAPPYMEVGSTSITISAGNATATAAVTFPYAFSSAPTVRCSGDSGLVICSAESVTGTGFTARITSNVALGTSHTETLSWDAAAST